MGHDPTQDYAPKRLAPRDLQAPLTAGMRRLPPAMRDDLHARKRDLVLRTDPLGERSLGRLRRYALGGAVFIPILASLLWPFAILFLVLDGQSPFSSGVGLVWLYHLAHICIGAAVGAIEDVKGLE